MMRFRLYVTTLVTSCNFWKLYRPLVIKVGRAREARLHAAVSSGEEYSMISVQRLDDLMVPRFFWLDLSARDIGVSRANQRRVEVLTVSMILVGHEWSSSFDLRLKDGIPEFLSRDGLASA